MNRPTGKLQNRLILLTLSITLPLFAISLIISNLIASDALTNQADEFLRSINQNLTLNINSWFTLNQGSLLQMSLSRDIESMDPVRQKPILQALTISNPNIYLASTTDTQGMNVSRSDQDGLTDYSDRQWFKDAISGQEFAFQTLIGRTSRKPSLVIAAPIHNDNNQIVGVAMFATTLASLTDQVTISKIGKNGYAYIIDDQNRIVVHPDPEILTELRDASNYPPVAALRSGTNGLYIFTDSEGRKWRSYLSIAQNDWGVIVQAPNDEILAPAYQTRTNAIIIIIFSTILLSILTALVARRIIGPINALTETAVSISGGNLNRVAPVQTNDEIGILGTAFNEMTSKLRRSLEELQYGIQQRTAQLERALRQIRTAADISTAIVSIRDTQLLLQSVVDLIRERFDFYYVGLFLCDERDEYAILRAGTGEAGEKMIAEGHRLLIGGSSMIGWCIARREARISQEVISESVRFKNPNLPLTRSEMALPIIGRQKVLGALSIQSSEANAFTQDDILVLQSIADNLATALENAELQSQAQQAIEEVRILNRSYVTTSWETALQQHGELQAQYHTARSKRKKAALQTVKIPLILRDNQIGEIEIELPGELSEEDSEFINALAVQTTLAIENARLLEETQRNAQQEQQINQLTALFSQSVSIEEILKTAVEEIGKIPGISEISIRLSQTQPQDNGHAPEEASA
jgi:GAF domain-containing protein/HAMP domain-containing protein